MYFTVIKGNEKLRKQYLVSFFLCWAVVGNIFATLMSSGGPCFYKYLVPGEDVYSGLFARLHEQNNWIITNIGGAEIWALKLQEMLWDFYTEDVTGLGSGISAMPSMHVSVAVLMALGTGALNKYLGYVFWLYAVIIQIGSVHLGWHYAVDGYIGGILTFIIWKMVGMIIATSTDDSAVIRSPQLD
ncbi:hypothetical protein GCM10017044_12970 [Kordiimonas sediminis]|uniref:Inositolphosphotransferase Aur1/Ipt1 domain-containing protein n=2 Tax=Kordiimonas sediminis TaxID=1735581 RepID=A0A919AQK2_9PROT|nr:hypothetical protein GCM10017044_12970 [Kordiimonas sediminis]